MKDRMKENNELSGQDQVFELKNVKILSNLFSLDDEQDFFKSHFKDISESKTFLVERLRSIFGDVEQDKVLETDVGVVASDVWLPRLDAYIVLDDVMYHGLDRMGVFTFEQISVIKDDIVKNRIVRDKKMTMFRLKSDVDLSKILTYDDLILQSYHICINGQIIKEGTFKFIDEDHAILSRDQLIMINETEIFPLAKGRSFTTLKILPLIREFFKAYVSYWGWFYPEKDDKKPFHKIVEQVTRGRMSPPELHELTATYSNGSSWLKSRFKSYWNVDNGPAKSFNDDNVLDKVLMYRLGLNNSKDYHYTLANKQRLTCRETFDINIKNVRFGFVVQRKAVSFFRPAFACDIYSCFLSDIEKPKVWDPSAGFGGRMLGAAASFGRRGGSYWACEPSSETFDDCNDLADEILRHLDDSTFDIIVAKMGSEDIRLPEEEFDFVFTSPPYFDKEKYVNEPEQCWLKYPNYNDWVKFYLEPTFKTAYHALKHDRYMVINIDQKNAETIVAAALAAGFELDRSKCVSLKLQADHFKRAKGNSAALGEPVLAFLKR